MNFINDVYANDLVPVTQVNDVPKNPESISSNLISTMVPMVLIFVVFYFLLFRPQEKKRREHEVFIQGIKKGEKIITNSGIYGTVISVNDTDQTIILEIAENTRIKILKSTISNLDSKKVSGVNANDKENKEMK